MKLVTVWFTEEEEKAFLDELAKSGRRNPVQGASRRGEDLLRGESGEDRS
jgi:hypothetical protein